MKPDARTYEIDGAAVTLTRVPIRRYDWDHRRLKEGEPFGHPMEQALYEIAINGELVGRASRSHGFGKQAFTIERLREGEDSWKLGEPVVWGRGYQAHQDRLYELDQVAAKAAELRKGVFRGALSRLPTSAEIAKYLAEEKATEAAEKIASEARSAQWARERAEEKRKAEEHRLEVLEGLESIAERLRAQLSNSEANALIIAIERYRIIPK